MAAREASDEMSDDRRSVKTYVPEDQKAIWQDHADDLGCRKASSLERWYRPGDAVFRSTEPITLSNPIRRGLTPG